MGCMAHLCMIMLCVCITILVVGHQELQAAKLSVFARTTKTYRLASCSQSMRCLTVGLCTHVHVVCSLKAGTSCPYISPSWSIHQSILVHLVLIFSMLDCVPVVAHVQHIDCDGAKTVARSELAISLAKASNVVIGVHQPCVDAES